MYFPVSFLAWEVLVLFLLGVIYDGHDLMMIMMMMMMMMVMMMMIYFSWCKSCSWFVENFPFQLKRFYRISTWCKKFGHQQYDDNIWSWSYCSWFRNPAPVEVGNLVVYPIIYRVWYLSGGWAWDFFHQHRNLLPEFPCIVGHRENGELCNGSVTCQQCNMRGIPF